MSTEQDPLELLRMAWDAQAPARVSEDLESQDQATRATVHYLRAAYENSGDTGVRHTPPAELLAGLPMREIPQRRSRLAPVASLVLAAAAAALLLLLARTDRKPQEFGPGSDVAEGSASSISGETTVALLPKDNVRHVAPDHFTSRSNGLELRSGSVRLILLQTELPTSETMATEGLTQ